MPSPPQVPAATPTTVTYPVLAAVAATAVKSVDPVDVQLGFIDSSGHGGGPNVALSAFPAIPAELLRARADDLLGEAGYRFWTRVPRQRPGARLEQRDGLAWTRHHDATLRLMTLYAESRRNLLVTALELLRKVDDRR